MLRKINTLFFTFLFLLMGLFAVATPALAQSATAYEPRAVDGGTNVPGINFVIDEYVDGELNKTFNAFSDGTNPFWKVGGSPCDIIYNVQGVNGTLIESASPCPNSLDAFDEYARQNPGSTDAITLGTSVDDVNDASQADTEEGVPDCNSSQSGGLGWIMCAGVEALTDVVGWFTTLIQQFLRVSPVVAENADGSESSVHIAWNGIKNISLFVLVVAALIAVFGQTFGIEAYTVKKMLPRIIIAAIGALLSFTIVAILVDLFNVLGEGIHDLLTEAVGLSVEVDFASFVTTTVTALVGGAGLAVGGLLWAGGVGGIGAASGTIALFVLLPLVLAVIGVFFTLIFRQILIILLIMVSPIALVAWTLPNTEKYFKLWFDTLVKALFMYPLIMILIASGQIYASILTSGPNSGAANLLVALLAIALPLFLVPFTFRFAGGAIATFNGAVRNFGKKTEESVKGDVRDPNSLRNRLAQGRLERRSHLGSDLVDKEKGEKYRSVFTRKGLNQRLAQLGSAPVIGKTAGIGLNTRAQTDAEFEALQGAQGKIEKLAKSPNAKVLDAILWGGAGGPPVWDEESQTYIPAPLAPIQDRRTAENIQNDPYLKSEVFAWGMNKYGGDETTIGQVMSRLEPLGLDSRDKASAMKRPQQGKLGVGNIKQIVLDTDREGGTGRAFSEGSYRHVNYRNMNPSEGAVIDSAQFGSLDEAQRSSYEYVGPVYDWDPRYGPQDGDTAEVRSMKASNRAAAVNKFMGDSDMSGYELSRSAPITFEAMSNFVTSGTDRDYGHDKNGRIQARIDRLKDIAHGGYGTEINEETQEIIGASQATPEAQQAAQRALEAMEKQVQQDIASGKRDAGYNFEKIDPRRINRMKEVATKNDNERSQTTQSTPSSDSGSPAGNISPGGVVLPTDEEVDLFNRNREE